MARTWLITGCSEGGIGAGVARSVLAHGDNAVVTARHIERIENIVKDYPETGLACRLDVTDKENIKEVVETAAARFGRIDVLVNAAGYCYRASVEESEEDGVMDMFQANFFGLIALTKAVLPIMRAQRSGMIINFSSIAALRAFPASGFYAATKSAVESVSEALSEELKPLGIKVMIVEPGPFRTHFFDSSLKGGPMTIEDYKETAWKRYPQYTVNNEDQAGSPDNAGKVLIAAVESGDPPARILLGKAAVVVAKRQYARRIAETEKWADLSAKADFDTV